MLDHETIKTDQQEILVVDDTPASLQLLTGILTGHGYRVRPSSDGRFALQSVAARIPDLILLDVKMLDMDGYEVCRRLKADELSRKIPVIFISALGETAERVEGFNAGGVDYITKPFEPEEVLARVGTHLRLWELTERLEQKVLEQTDELTTANQQLRQEITQRKRAEEALRESKERFRNLVETTSDWVWEVDQNGVYTYVNPIVGELLGYDVDEVLGKTPFDFMPPREAERIGAYFESIVASQEPITNLENINVHKDGHLVYLETSGVPFFSPNGELLGYRGIDRDINERRLAEEELKKHRDHLEDLVKELTNELAATQEELVKHEKLSVLGQLTATVSHELRNPLGVIRSSTFYVESNLSDVDEKITKHLKRIDEQVGLCDSIIGDLMEYTQGRPSEMLERELNPFLEEVLAGMTFPEPVHMLREMAPDLPMVRFDREKLQRVMNNLVTNAIQAVVVRQEGWKEEEGPYQPQVKLATSLVEDGVCIEVEDNGAGMDEETAARVFEPLFTTRARGSGLGLSIVKKIVEEHGGTVSLDSGSDRGTKAIIVISHR